MAQANLAHAGFSIDTSNDSIVIVDNFQSIRGGYTLNTLGYFEPVIYAGHPIIEETSTGYLKPMPATYGTSSAIATFGTVVPGSGYTNGTYTNVPLVGGSGKGALATIVVASNVISTVTKTVGGAGYAAGDTIYFNPTTVGGTGSGGSVPVATVASAAGAFGTLPSGHTYAGVLINTVEAIRPMAGIMVRGTVNHIAFSPAAYSTILTAIKAALPLIDFRGDRTA